MRSADGLTLGGHRHFAAHEAHAGFSICLVTQKPSIQVEAGTLRSALYSRSLMSKPPQAAFERPVFDFFLHSPFTFID